LLATTDRAKQLLFAVDDEADILELIAIHARKAGFHIKTFSRAEPMLKALTQEIPDLIILDLMLPDLDGLEICKRLKKDDRTAGIPILILTAKGDETDVVLGLELGADDYMVKPFSPKELVARVRAVLRRPKGAGSEAGPKWRIGNILEIDDREHAVRVGDRKVELTATEFAILMVLIRNPGWVFSRDQLMDKIWGEDKAALDRTIDVHVKNLRDKLGEAGRLIKSVRGVGYKLEP
jgi:two-component system phosphate regulon response regulator PhoB/two-component system alkaline phosphatase synthesis response regulator PhoP